ncbi:MAG TPA: DUF1453 domain-containing protein [Luteimonas sp.]|nr:DUF1453 domain-containing protein [Luteimonas sp.]
MPLLLLLPLALLLFGVAWIVLLPLVLRQRYRQGHARRRAYRWLLRVNAWGFLVSVAGFLATAWLATSWSPPALRDAALGAAVGAPLALAGIALTRFEVRADGVHYTPNRWMALLLTLLVAARIAAGVWWSWARFGGGASTTPLAHALQAGGVWAVGGMLLGYAATYAWGIHLRHRRLVR